MARKSIHEDRAPKSQWLNAKKRVEKEVKPMFPQVSGELKCPFCGTVNQISMYAQVESSYPNDRFWAIGYCQKGECGRNICGFVDVAS